jgi:hypothetical protein
MEIGELNKQMFELWVESLPEVVQPMVRSKPPHLLYNYEGRRVTIHSYGEDGTVTVNITGEFNLISFSRQVFGIPYTELTECAGPEADETLGDMCTQLGIDPEDFIKNIREDKEDA